MKDIGTAPRRRHLRAVDESYRAGTRAYVLYLGDDDAEFMTAVAAMERDGLILINGDEDRSIDEVDLRLHLQCLAIADVLVMSNTWWTSVAAHQLTQIASWVGIKQLTVPEVPAVTREAAR